MNNWFTVGIPEELLSQIPNNLEITGCEFKHTEKGEYFINSGMVSKWDVDGQSHLKYFVIHTKPKKVKVREWVKTARIGDKIHLNGLTYSYCLIAADVIDEYEMAIRYDESIYPLDEKRLNLEGVPCA